jgi:outer membrane protein assembly factor BamB/Icc-related predicted phosphoesterase
MKRITACLASAILILALFTSCARLSGESKIPDFTFAHVSDIHIEAHADPLKKAPVENRGASIPSIPTRASISLEPFKTTVSPATFIVATGDLTEYGDAGVTWDDFLQNFRDLSVPLFIVLGNHDATWVCMWDRMRERYGAVNYSFNLYGCHFVGLNSTSLQEPVASLSEEAIEFVRSDLGRVSQSTPVFVLLHHPPWADQFASEYEIDRLYDVLHQHNVVAILYGHGHRVEHRIVNGIDTLQGGQTYGKIGGCGIYAVKDGIFYATHRYFREKPTVAMLKKPLFRKGMDYLDVRILEPQDRQVIKGDELSVEVSIAPAKRRIKEAYCVFDGDQATMVQLTGAKDAFEKSISTRELFAGAHVLKVVLTAEDGTSYTRSLCFYVEKENSPTVRWRKFFPAGIKSTPVVAQGLVYFGANDGSLRALDANTGELKWSFQTHGEIQAQPLVHGDTVYFGSGDNYFYAFTLDGTPKWVVNAGSPIYSTASADEGTIFFGTKNSGVYAVDAETDRIRWIFSDFNYGVESKIVVAGDSLYFGAWDGYIYALDKATGNLMWRELTLKAQEGKAIRYYSAPDCPPVIADGKVFAVDIGGYVGSYNAVDGSGSRIVQKNAGAIALSHDGKALYCRLTKGGLKKIDFNGAEIWRCFEPTGRLPIPPIEQDGVVYTTSNTGNALAIDAASGKLLWHYQATPQLWVMAGLAASDDAIFVAGLDGSLTAIEIPPAASGSSNKSR